MHHPSPPLLYVGLAIQSLTLALAAYGVYLMSTTATQQDLDDAITGLETSEAARDAAVTSALNDLLAKLAQPVPPTPIDLSSEVARILALHTKSDADTATATTDDPGPATTAPVVPTV